MGRGKVKNLENFDGKSDNTSNQFSKSQDQCSIELTSTYNNSESSAQVNICDCDGPEQDCLHNAAKHGESEEIKYLLEKGADANSIDKNGRTALHWISAVDCSCESCTENSEDCMKYFLFGSYGTNIDVQDSNGETPLFLAVEHQNIKCANLLVSLGANVTLVNNRGKDALSKMAKKAPEVMVSVMDRAITIDKLNPNNEKCVVKVNFSAIVGYPLERLPRKNQIISYSDSEPELQNVRREMTLFTLLLGASRASQKTILAHPLAAIFLTEKWKRVRKYFISFFVCYVFWLLSYTSYIIKVYLVSCPCEYFSKPVKKEKQAPENLPIRSRDDKLDVNLIVTSGEERCHLQTGLTFEVAFIIFLTLIMVMNEVGKIIVSPKLYIKNKLNAANWILFITVIITTGPVIMEPNTKPEPWQYQAAAMAIFLSWGFLLSQLGTFPYLGRYIEILGHVLNNFAMSMLTFSSLLVAFALSFNVLFPGEDEAFSHFFYAILKVLVMMTGEVDYQDTFYDKENDSTRGPIVGHILYAAFVIIIAIVLMNLLIGLTVSDIQSILKEAEFTRMSRQIGDISRQESAFFAKKLKWKGLNFLRRSISVLRPAKTNKEGDSTDRSISEPLIEKPNDRKDRSIPEPLKQEILKIAIRNYHLGIGSARESEGVKSSTRSLRSKNTISLTSE